MNGMRITRVKDLSRSAGTWAALALAATAAITVTAGASGAQSPPHREFERIQGDRHRDYCGCR